MRGSALDFHRLKTCTQIRATENLAQKIGWNLAGKPFSNLIATKFKMAGKKIMITNINDPTPASKDLLHQIIHRIKTWRSKLITAFFSFTGTQGNHRYYRLYCFY